MHDFLVYASAAFSAFFAAYYAWHKYRGGNSCPPDCVDGRIIVITGATSGIGKAAAGELVRRGAVVVLACRNLDAANKLAVEFTRSSSTGRAIALHLDLSSFNSVRHFVDRFKEEFSRVDVLINNAAMGGVDNLRVITKDGHEECMQVNHYSPLALTLLLLPLLKTSDDPRVVFVCSSLYKKAKLDFDNLDCEKLYKPFFAYQTTKLVQLLCAQELARLLKKSGSSIGIYTMQPGIVNTDLFRNICHKTYSKFLLELFKLFFFKTPYQGAQTVLYCTVAKHLRGHSGKFYGNCLEEALETEMSRDEALAKRIWDVSLAKIGFTNYQF